jgi:hypothetical protein
MVLASEGLCGACDRPMLGKLEPCIDHDHQTLKVRGLLCAKCNTAIARLGDNEAGLRRALAYLVAAR